MLTDWERRQLAEIERGLAEDHAVRGRAWRAVGTGRVWGLAALLFSLICLIVLLSALA